MLNSLLTSIEKDTNEKSIRDRCERVCTEEGKQERRVNGADWAEQHMLSRDCHALLRHDLHLDRVTYQGSHDDGCDERSYEVTYVPGRPLQPRAHTNEVEVNLKQRGALRYMVLKAGLTKKCDEERITAFE